MKRLHEILDESILKGQYRLYFDDIEQITSDVHSHHQLIEDDESDMIIKDKYAISITPEERDIMVKYHALLLRLHCESWVSADTTS